MVTVVVPVQADEALGCDVATWMVRAVELAENPANPDFAGVPPSRGAPGIAIPVFAAFFSSYSSSDGVVTSAWRA